MLSQLTIALDLQRFCKSLRNPFDKPLILQSAFILPHTIFNIYLNLRFKYRFLLTLESLL